MKRESVRRLALACLLASSVALPSLAEALVAGQVDTFSGSIESWFAGGGPSGQAPLAPPTVVASGGPGGVGDAFMLVTSSGSFDPGGRLVAINATQWAGDYLSEGVTGIEMDLRNFGGSDLTLRLYFADPIPGPPANEAISSLGVTLAAGGGWTHVLFPITALDLTVLMGDASVLLSNTTVLRLFHSPDLAFPGARVAGLLGVDNIGAVSAVAAVPEPATLALLVLGLAGLGFCRRKQ